MQHQAGRSRCGLESGVWTAPLVVEHVRRRYGTQYALTSMYDLLHRIGFSCRRPKASAPKIGLRTGEKGVQKKVRRTARWYAAKGYSVLTLDESSHIIGWNVHNGWYPKGRPVTTAVSLSHKRFYSFGALSNGKKKFLCRFYDRANTDSFVDFVGYLHKRYEKVLLFVDNASYHRSSKVQEEVKKLGGKVVMRYFLPYTPELNPTEGQ